MTIIELYEFIKPCKRIKSYILAKQFLKLAEKSILNIGSDCYEDSEKYRFQAWIDSDRDNTLSLVQFVCNHNHWGDKISVTFNQVMRVCVTINFYKQDIENAEKVFQSIDTEELPF